MKMVTFTVFKLYHVFHRDGLTQGEHSTSRCELSEAPVFETACRRESYPKRLNILAGTASTHEKLKDLAKTTRTSNTNAENPPGIELF